MAPKLPFVLCVVAIWAVTAANGASPNAAAAPPAASCSELVMTMTDCLTYVSNDSTINKPEGNCCPALKDILDNNADCVCEGFNTAAQLGITVNVTRAKNLPATCALPNKNVPDCHLAETPAAPGAAAPPKEASPPPTAAAASPMVGCSDLVMTMTDCLSYVSNDSTVTKPEGNCCPALKAILDSNADCVCEGFTTAAQLGITVNVTRAKNLPATCSLPNKNVPDCHLADTPGAATPGQSATAPSSSSLPTPDAAPAPSMGPAASDVTPAPAPAAAEGAAASPLLSAGSLLLCLLGVAAFSAF